MHRPDIDGLRGLAIASVVAFHAFPEYFGGGYSGVDIFFVISGFVISRLIFESLDTGQFSLRVFYADRIKRIFPALILVLAFIYTFAWFLLFPDEFKQLGMHIAASAGFIQNFVLLNESGYFDTSAELKPLLHLWSLAVEEQFYLIYPILLWSGRLAKFRPATTLSILFAVSFYLNIVGIKGDPAALFFSPQTRFWELLAGAILATSFFERERLARVFRTLHKTALDYISVLGLSLIILSVLLLSKDDPSPGWQGLIPVTGTFLLILAGPDALINKNIMSSKILVLMGKISFSLYLWHWPILSFAAIIESHTPSAWVRFASVMISVVLSSLSYLLVERPIHIGPVTLAKTVVLMILMCTLGCIGYSTFQLNGIESRRAANVARENRVDYSYKHDCSKLMGGEAMDLDWCNADKIDTSEPNVLLIGDSIANSYSAMLYAYIESNNRSDMRLAQFGRGECPGLIGYGPRYCKEMVDAISAQIKSSKAVHTVILAANWPDYFNGKTAFRQARHEESKEQFLSAFKRTLSFYANHGKRVIVFLTPPQGHDPKSCLMRTIRLSDRNGCKLSIARARRNDGEYRETILPYLASLNVDIFDPFQMLCDLNECKIRDGQKVLYYDRLHISQYGTRYLAEASKNALILLFPRKDN